ncbi:DNA alkylation repair protein [Helicobacter mastomyrinus]|uniref:DNA alkylation repair protein n=1 Tax=Helicobacter mastomyrinus TaxID=287948 RepID=A0ABZ3FA13_9HELI|nr:DNA alkylation repair protein [uncultured Helicobacter sp.]
MQDESVNATLLEYSKDSNIWLRRIAILHQLLRKERTNTQLLESIIINNLNHKEPFINKVIGWALCDFSKYNPQWISAFLQKHKDSLSVFKYQRSGQVY